MKKILTVLSSNAFLTEKEIEKIISEVSEKTAEEFRVLPESMLYSANGGGKRIRPTLTIEFCKLFSGDVKAALPLAAAVELVHTYSLIHDDLPCMDNDDTRRGKPTNHKVFGEATALLAGDGLLTLAFSVICSSEELSSEAKVKAVKMLADFAGANGMIGGQQIDLIGEKEMLTKAQHRQMNLLKTGALIKCAALLGCIAAGADEKAFEAAEIYAENVGIAFQVTDDILDMGEEDQKTTYLSFMTKDEAVAYAKELTEKAVDAVKNIDGSETLVELAGFLAAREV